MRAGLLVLRSALWCCTGGLSSAWESVPARRLRRSDVLQRPRRGPLDRRSLRAGLTRRLAIRAGALARSLCRCGSLRPWRRMTRPRRARLLGQTRERGGLGFGQRIDPARQRTQAHMLTCTASKVREYLPAFSCRAAIDSGVATWCQRTAHSKEETGTQALRAIRLPPSSHHDTPTIGAVTVPRLRSRPRARTAASPVRYHGFRCPPSLAPTTAP